MGNGYNQHHHLHNLHKNTFLPMLCSNPSIKDVAALPKYRDRSSFSNDPSSPRVGCMGQVKRHNRVIGFPSTTTTTSCKFTATTTTSKFNTIGYFKLKKLFSSKNLITPTTTVTTAISTSSSSCGGRNQTVMDGCYFGFNEDPPINVADLDPPLPVIKKVHKRKDSGDAENLWRRRKSAGVALRTLQIQQIHTPNQFLHPTSA